MAPSEMRQRFQSLISSVEEKAGEAILENKEEIIALVVGQQYEQGVDSEGVPLRQYTPYYKHLKAQAGLYQGHTDFHLSGEMQSEMNISINGSEYSIDSPATTSDGVLKTEWLKDWQGAPVMELTEENKAVAAEIIAPVFLEKMEAGLD